MTLRCELVLVLHIWLLDVLFFIIEQDIRWGDAEKKLLRRTKFSKVLEQKVSSEQRFCDMDTPQLSSFLLS